MDQMLAEASETSVMTEFKQEVSESIAYNMGKLHVMHSEYLVCNGHYRNLYVYV